MNKPKKRFHLYVDYDIYDKIDEIAKRNHSTITDEMRRALVLYIERDKKIQAMDD